MSPKTAAMIRRALAGTGLGLVSAVGYVVYSQDEEAYSKYLMPAIQQVVDAESAHKLAVWATSKKLFPEMNYHYDRSLLSVNVCNLQFENPLGMAAGFDKDGECAAGLAKMGFGFVEAGSVTPLPQPGNPKPRVFRLPEDSAVINRYGFNSAGHEAVRRNLAEYRESKSDNCVLGINLGKNKTSPSAVDDYTAGVKVFAELADYLVVNVSSPNTPGLRNLQMVGELEGLINGVLTTRDQVQRDGRYVPVFLKIAPDLDEQSKKDIARVAVRRKVDGLIVSNTTVARPAYLESSNKGEKGGLSGAPVKEMSTTVISDMYRLTKGNIPIIGVGGVATGQDAYDKIKAGASLIQVYTSFTYHGPPLVKKILRELETLVAEDGLKNVSQAVGMNHK